MISFSNNVNKLFREINKKKCFRPLAKENCINFSENSTILIFIVVISEMRKVLHYCILKTLCVQDKSDCIHLVFQNKSIMFPFYFCYIFIYYYFLVCDINCPLFLLFLAHPNKANTFTLAFFMYTLPITSQHT